jgi:uncharacterized protein DUF481
MQLNWAPSRNCCRSISCFGILLVLGTTPAAAQDRITLTNGDVLTGQVRSASPVSLAFESALAGAVTVKWMAVSRMTSTTQVRVVVKDGSPLEGALEISDGQLTIRRPDGAPVTLAPADISELQIVTGGTSPARWHGSLDGDLARSRGNSETLTVAATGRATRLGERDKLGLFGTYLFSQVGGDAEAVTTARTTRGGARYDHDVAGRLYGFVFSDVENDPLQLLDLRLVAGGGTGAHLINRRATQFNVFGGISYARDAYAEQATSTTTSGATGGGGTTGPAVTPPGQGGTPPGLSGIHPKRGGTPPSVVRTSLSRSVSELVVGQDLMHQLSDTVNVTESLTLFPALNDASDYRVSFDVTLAAQLNAWLQWSLSVSDRYLHIPPAGGAVQNDLFVSTGIGVSFGSSSVGGFGGADRPDVRR